MVSISLFSRSALSNKMHIQKEKERTRERREGGRVGWTGKLLFRVSEDVFPQMRFLSTADCNLPGQIRL